MKRFGSLVAGFALVALISGCPSGKDAPKGDGAPKTTDKDKAPADKKVAETPKKGGKVEVLDAKTDAVVKVKVSTDAKQGDVIKALEAHQDKETCLAGTEEEKREQTWIVGKDGGLANVVVWFEAPAGKKFADAKAEGTAYIDQPHCAFVPHVVVVKPGQKFVVKNSSKVLHNSKITGDASVDNVFNPTIKAGEEAPIDLKSQRDPLDIACSIHPWMGGKIFAPSHPYIAVTNEKGELTIANVPSGVELKMVIWHEGKGKTEETVTLKAGDNTFEKKLSK
jgi:plastocyanin